MRTVYIAHHGIDGQKWGERNGPPYPLKPGMRSPKEKRLNPNSSEGKKKLNKSSVEIAKSYAPVASTIAKDVMNQKNSGELVSDAVASLKKAAPGIQKAMENYNETKNHVDYDFSDFTDSELKQLVDRKRNEIAYVERYGGDKNVLPYLSDTELRDAVNRLGLEQSYTALSQDKVKEGKAYIDKAFGIGITALGVTATALTIANQIVKLRKATKG